MADEQQAVTLAQRMKAKYPGVYDHIPDIELEQKVLAKYPDVEAYRTIPRTNDPSKLPTKPAATEDFVEEQPSYLSEMVGGAVDRVKEVGRGIAENINSSLDMTSGKTPMEGPGLGTVVRGMAETPMNVLSAINTDDPKQAGSAIIDAVGMLPAVIGMKRGMAPVARATVEAGKKVAGVPAVKTAARLASDFLPGASGRATRHLVDELKETRNAPAGPRPGTFEAGPDRSRFIDNTIPEPDVVDIPEEPVHQVFRGPGTSAEGPGVASPSRNAGGQLVPGEAVQAGIRQRLEELLKTRSTPDVDAPSLDDVTDAKLTDAMESPARAGATTPFMRETPPKPVEGARLNTSPTPEPNIEDVIREALEDTRATTPAGVSPTPKIADPGSARRPATTDTLTRTEAEARTNVQTEARNRNVQPQTPAPKREPVVETKSAPVSEPSGAPASKSKRKSAIPGMSDGDIAAGARLAGMTPEEYVQVLLKERAERQAGHVEMGRNVLGTRRSASDRPIPPQIENDIKSMLEASLKARRGR